ncbi:transcriptional regulator [Deinococcus aetherius]|uniref:Transcriptional regulator n=1 Tax=Deinococcus aetherius TaxID=200252 RepID=A0ABM8ABJ1_9DEIO|nr:transcriptional regulator [Deinococcus aetherius]
MVEKDFLPDAEPEATAQVLAAYLKRHGPATVPQLRAALRLSENAVRHHLQALERHGLLTREGSTGPGRGRPATRYALTARAEGLFPKRYLELLDAVLTAARTEGLEERLLARVAADMAARVQPPQVGLDGSERLYRLLQLLDYGDLLPELEVVPAGVCLHAYNCVYVEAGRRHPAVCELLPGVITAATGLKTTRLRCQRDGARACEFMVNTVG